MMIKKLKVKNIRGKSFDLELGDMNLIVGPNRSGKTTIADSIRFALMGYIPGMPPPPRQWGELLADSKIGSVHLQTEIGDFNRWITPQPGGTVKVDPTEPIAECDLALNTLTLDAAEYFAATGPARAEILARCSATDIEWHNLVSESLKKRYPYTAREPWHAWVNQSLDKAKGHSKDAKAQASMYQQTVRGLMSMRAVQAPDPTQKQNELQALHERIGQQKHAISVLDLQIKQGQQPSRILEADRQLSKVRSQLQANTGGRDEKTYQKRFEYNELQITALKAKKGYLEPEGYAKLSQEYGKTNTQRVTALEKLRELELEHEGIAAKYADLQTAGKCPTCGTTGQTFAHQIHSAQAVEIAAINIGIRKKQEEAKKFVASSKLLEAKIIKAREINVLLGECYKQQRELQSEKARIDLWNRHDELVKQLTAVKAEEVDLTNVKQAKYDRECELDETQEQINALTVEVNKIQHVKFQKKQLAETEELLKKTEDEHAQLIQDVKDLDDLRKRFTVMSLAPILKKVAMFTEGIFEEPLRLDGSEIGRFVGAKWVTLRQFSGTEQMVAQAALTAALAVEGKENFLVCDELGVVDDTHLSVFLNNVRTAVNNKVITQFIGLTTPRGSGKHTHNKNLEIIVL